MGRQWLAIAAKAAISLLLIWLLVSRIDLSETVSRLGRLSPAGAIGCVILLAGQLALMALRWRRVADILGVALGRTTVLRITAVGAFFNQTLPSSIGGDAVRVWLVMREGTALGKAFNVVLCDRVLGLVVLVGLIAVTLPLLYAH